MTVINVLKTFSASGAEAVIVNGLDFGNTSDAMRTARAPES
jgi:hypothetical protein